VPPTDSTVVRNYSFNPLFTANTKANVTSVRLGGQFRHTFRLGSGFSLMTSFNSEKEQFRLQDRSNDRKSFQNTLMHRFGLSGWSVDMNHMDSRMFNRVISVRGGFQDVVLNTLTVGGGLRHTTLAPDNFRWDGRLRGALADAEKSFKTDKSVGAEVGGGFGYNLLDGWLVVRGRAYVKDLEVTSISSLKTYPGLGLREDSLSADAEIHFSESQFATFEYDQYSAEEDFTDQKRESLGGQIEGAENLFEERRTVEASTMNVGFTSRMLDRIALRVAAQHSDQLTVYKKTKTRFGQNVVDYLKSDIQYTFFTGTKAMLKTDLTKASTNLGEASVSSHDRRSRKLDVSMNHRFASGFSVDVSGSALLVQTFYWRYKDNPRDQDQLEHRVQLRINSKPFSKISAGVMMSLMQTDFINIDKTLSSNNRVKSQYEFRPTFTYTMNSRVTIKQNYGLRIEFTDNTFKPEDNFLDRNISFSNELAARFSGNLRGVFYYSYLFHDRGSYLPLEEGGERFLDIEREDRRDQIRIQFDYKMTEHLSLLGKQDYSRRQDRTIGSSNVRVTEDGGIEVGVKGNYSWSTDRTLNLTLMKANRFGSFSTEAQKDYWIVDASFKYSF